MTHPEDRPDTAERYARALGSHHLEVVPDERGDVDLLVAAGWTQETLGTRLYRLRTEFDGVRAEHQLAQQNLAIGMERARELGRTKPVPSWATERERDEALASIVSLKVQAAHVARDAENQARTALALILVHLKSLSPARDALSNYAVRMATQRHLMRDDAAVLAIAGRALQNWLSPLCLPCGGRGFFGAVHSLRRLCTACSGTRLHQVQMASDDTGHQFGRALLVEMDRKTDVVARLMRRFLAFHRRRGEPDQQQLSELRQRIAGMRTTEAETD